MNGQDSDCIRRLSTYFTFIMCTIPKVLFITNNGLFGKPVQEKTVVFLHHTKHNRTASCMVIHVKRHHTVRLKVVFILFQADSPLHVTGRRRCRRAVSRGLPDTSQNTDTVSSVQVVRPSENNPTLLKEREHILRRESDAQRTPGNVFHADSGIPVFPRFQKIRQCRVVFLLQIYFFPVCRLQLVRQG